MNALTLLPVVIVFSLLAVFVKSDCEADDEVSIEALINHPLVRKHVDPLLLQRPEPAVGGEEAIRILKALRKETDRIEADHRSANPKVSSTPAVQLYDDVVSQFNHGRLETLPDDFGMRAEALAEAFHRVSTLHRELRSLPALRFGDAETFEMRIDQSVRLAFQIEQVRLCTVGRFKEAVDLLQHQLLLARLLMDSDGHSFNMDGCGLVESCGTAARRLSRNWDLPEPQLLRLLQLMTDHRMNSKQAQRALSLTFQKLVLSDLTKIPASGSIGERVASQFRNSIQPNRAARSRRLFAQDLNAVLAGHPTPFLVEETLRLASRLWMERLKRLDDNSFSMANLPDELQAAEEAWPIALRLDPFSTLEWRISDSYQSLQPQQISKSKDKLAKIRNPVGKHLVACLLDLDVSAVYFTHRANVDGTRIVLAMHLFHRRHKRLPGRLRELVTTGILNELPEDPFGDEFGYAPEGGLIWSRWLDGVDHQGRTASGYGAFELLSRMNRLIPRELRRPLPPPRPEPAGEGADRIFIVVRRGHPILDARWKLKLVPFGY